MNDFKVGDRVEYVGSTSRMMEGKSGVVVDSLIQGSSMVFVEYGGSKPWGCFPDNLRHLPAPDVITIDRADLPEVRQEGDAVIIVRGKGVIYTANHNPETARASAADFLALAEFLEAREKAAEEAKAKLNKRRNDLAKEVAKRACYVNYQNFTYEDHVPAAQAAINMFIELEDPRG